ncbi:MAG: Tol-Pal system beta propeller repeat protein TolB [Deltaproteobacteria bacterium]|nr:Tol-Pal system beta propeller repeat protein TolB [Deltaproteobacteria bacterium]
MRLFISVLVILAVFLSGEARAKVYIDLSAPAVERIPIAVQEFKDLGGSIPPETLKALRDEIMDTLKSDLVFSGIFKIVDKEAHIEDPKAGLTEAETNFKDWRTSGADTLIKAGFTAEKDRVTVEIRFFDCFKEKQIVGKKYIGSPNSPRRLMHYFADQLYEELTGRKGIFTSRILFVSGKTGNKEIYISDYDGKNVIQLTRNRSINLSPQWSPDGKKILYISYKKGFPGLYMLDLRTGEDRAVSNKPGINIGGRFSPDGNKIALTLSGEKSPELHVIDLNTGEDRKLTDNYGIDVSPTWSPDGKRIAFVSDTSGNPHIFVVDLGTASVKRLTFDGKYNSSPSWSPDGKLIAFSRSDSGKFNIWVMRANGSGATQLTFSGSNRNPSWSPDGRYIIYSSSSGGASSLFIMQSDGTGARKITTGVGNETSPAWSPYLQ